MSKKYQYLGSLVSSNFYGIDVIPLPSGTCTIFKPKYSPNSLCEWQKPIRLLVNQLKKRKETAIRKADKASANVFKGLFAHRQSNPPVI